MPNTPQWLEIVFAGGWLATLIAAVWGPIKDWRSGRLRLGRAEADAADAAVPMSGAERQVALAQQVSTNLATELAACQERLRQRNAQLAEADLREALLRAQIRDRDDATDELERRFEACEGQLAVLRDDLEQARAQIVALRAHQGPHRAE